MDELPSKLHKLSSWCLMHEHLLVCRSRGPPAASGSSSSAFTSMKDKCLRVLCLVSSWAEYPPPQPHGHALATLAAVCLGPVVQPTNLWFWPTFQPHSSGWKVLETHSFPMNPISCSQAVVSSVQAYLLHPAAPRIWIFHYGNIILQMCQRIRFLRVRGDVHTFLYMSVIAAGCLHWPDMQIPFYMSNSKPLGWVCVDGHVIGPLGSLWDKEKQNPRSYFVGSQPANLRACFAHEKGPALIDTSFPN